MLCNTHILFLLTCVKSVTYVTKMYRVHCFFLLQNLLRNESPNRTSDQRGMKQTSAFART